MGNLDYLFAGFVVVWVLLEIETLKQQLRKK